MSCPRPTMLGRLVFGGDERGRTIDYARNQAREGRRKIARAKLEMKTERRKLEKRKTVLRMEAVEYASRRNERMLDITVKNMQRAEKATTRLYNIEGRLEAVGWNVEALKGGLAIMRGMESVAAIMNAMNMEFTGPEVSNLLQNLSSNTVNIDTKMEMFMDAADDIDDEDNMASLNGGGEPTSLDELKQSILDEAGVNMAIKCEATPVAPPSAAVVADSEHDALLSRYMVLRGGGGSTDP